jgi:hypothetical protein
MRVLVIWTQVSADTDATTVIFRVLLSATDPEEAMVSVWVKACVAVSPVLINPAIVDLYSNFVWLPILFWLFSRHD